jgi:EAL domain-containing protein (putative c-di-GMP-specific phosphodiesterase class I)
MTLYAAKAAGRPRTWRVYEPALRADFAAAAARRSGLERAVRDQEFRLHYQPIVWLADLSLAAFETLVRWPQPDGSLMTPDDFIPLAEATGEILPLGRWILRTATAQAAEWNRTRAAQGLPPIKVTVNASAHEVRADDFAAAVGEALDDSGLDPDDLVLEITESVLIRHADAAVAHLRAIARHGVRVALDDFGTGYSSLGYLHDLPVTGLKIDKMFVAGARDSARKAALVRGIIGIGKSLGLNIVAEGLETVELAELFQSMGANLGQGYLFGRPEPASRAEGWALDGGPLAPPDQGRAQPLG